MKNNVNMEVKM